MSDAPPLFKPFSTDAHSVDLDAGKVHPAPLLAPSATDPAGRWTALALTSGAVVCAMTTWFSGTAILPQLKSIWGISDSTGAFLTAAVQLGFVIGALVSSLLSIADRVPPRTLIAAASLAAATTNILMLLTDSSDGFALALVLRGLTGFTLAYVYPPGMKFLSTWFKRGRGLALGAMVGAIALGSALPHLVKAIGNADWEFVVISTSVLPLVACLLIMLATDGPLKFPPAVFDLRQVGEALSNRGVLLACIGYWGHQLELYAVWTWFSKFYRNVLLEHSDATQAQEDDTSFKERDAALAAFGLVGMGAFGACWAGWYADSYGRSRVSIISLVVSGLCSLLIGVISEAAHPGWVLAIGLVWGFFIVSDSAQYSTIVTEVADQRYVGTGLTVQFLIGFLITIPSIIYIGAIESSIGWTFTFATLAPGPIIGVLAMYKLYTIPKYRELIAGGRG